MTTITSDVDTSLSLSSRLTAASTTTTAADGAGGGGGCLEEMALEFNVKAESPCSCWTEEYLIDEIFLRLAGTKEIVKHNGRCINVYKYYSQAFRLRRWIPIAKPAHEFTVNMSDLTPTPRIMAELKALDKDSSQYVLKQAVGRIFENINFRQYHLSIARNLEVVMKP
jgi:hypothetical protein